MNKLTKVFALLLVVALASTTFYVGTQLNSTVSTLGDEQNVSPVDLESPLEFDPLHVSLNGESKLHVNESSVYEAVVSGGSGNFGYVWSVDPLDGKTVFVSDGDTCSFMFVVATVDPYVLTVEVTDLVSGNKAFDSFTVYDPYTLPDLYLEASLANFDYRVKGDGAGWFFVSEGVSGKTLFSSTVLSDAVDYALASAVSGNILLDGVYFNYSLTVPVNVSVTESVDGLTRVFVNSVNSQGSPYTVSVDTVQDGYYMAQDSMSRVINSWTSTNENNVFGNVTAVLATTGGTIYVKNGIYTVSGNPDVAGWRINQNNIRVIGESWNTIFTIPDSFNAHVILITGTNVTIENIVVNGNYLNQDSDGDGQSFGINAYNATNVLIDRCYVTQCWSEAIGLTWGTQYSTVSNCIVNDTQTSGIVMYGFVNNKPTMHNTIVDSFTLNCGNGAVLGNGVYTDGASYSTIDNVVVENVNDCGVEIRGGYDNSYGMTASNLNIKNCVNSGILLDGTKSTYRLYNPTVSTFSVTNSSGILVVNYVQKPTVSDGIVEQTTGNGLHLSTYVTDGTFNFKINNTSADGIKIDGSGSTGNNFEMTALNCNTYGVEILTANNQKNNFYNCKISAKTQDGFYTESAYTTFRDSDLTMIEAHPAIHYYHTAYGVISNNRVYLVSGANGIYLSGVTDTTVKENQVLSVAGSSISGISVLAASYNNTITDNTVVGTLATTRGILFWTGGTLNSTFISGNTLRALGTGIYVQVAGVSSTIITENNFNGCLNPISDSGTGTVIKNNVINGAYCTTGTTPDA